MKHVTSKYPDAALSKALNQALKVKVADPCRARIAWQRAFDLLQRRGTSVSFGAGGGGLMLAHPVDPDAQRRQQAIDAAHQILASALSMGEMAADYRKTLAACARFFAAKRPRRPPLMPKVYPLTPRESEVMQIVNECKGNLAAAARRFGIDRSSLKECYDAGNRKLARMGVPIPSSRPTPKTTRLPVDRRGQVRVAKDRR